MLVTAHLACCNGTQPLQLHIVRFPWQGASSRKPAGHAAPHSLLPLASLVAAAPPPHSAAARSCAGRPAASKRHSALAGGGLPLCSGQKRRLERSHSSRSCLDSRPSLRASMSVLPWPLHERGGVGSSKGLCVWGEGRRFGHVTSTTAPAHGASPFSGHWFAAEGAATAGVGAWARRSVFPPALAAGWPGSLEQQDCGQHFDAKKGPHLQQEGGAASMQAERTRWASQRAEPLPSPKAPSCACPPSQAWPWCTRYQLNLTMHPTPRLAV